MRHAARIAILGLLFALGCEDDVAWQTPAPTPGSQGDLCATDADCAEGLRCSQTSGLCGTGEASDTVGGDAGGSGFCADLFPIGTFVPDQSSASAARDEDERLRITLRAFEDGEAAGQPVWLRLELAEGLPGWPQSDGARVDLADLPVSGEVGFRVFLELGCDEQGEACAHALMATAGRAIVQSIDWSGAAQAAFAGTLSNLTLSEVLFGEQDQPLLVFEGCTLSLSRFEWSLTLPEP